MADSLAPAAPSPANIFAEMPGQQSAPNHIRSFAYNLNGDCDCPHGNLRRRERFSIGNSRTVEAAVQFSDPFDLAILDLHLVDGTADPTRARHGVLDERYRPMCRKADAGYARPTRC